MDGGRRRGRWVAGVAGAALMAAVTSALASGAQRQPPEVRAVDVRLPSASTGVPDGALAVRVFPATRRRYETGSPVVVLATGGTGAGNLRPFLPTAGDLVRIVFLFPGGADPPGLRSDGTYDQRGQLSIAALADVVRFAAGEATDSEGRTLADLVEVPPAPGNVGVVGTSNGGNIAVAAAAKAGDLAAQLRWIVQWESPVSSQAATVDLGPVRLECPEAGRRASLPALNPRYTGYGPLEMDLDYGDIAYDPASVPPRVFLDGNGNGRYDTSVDPASGCRTPDTNGDGSLSLTEDFLLQSFAATSRRVYSRPATAALAEKLGTIMWPPEVADPDEADAFWDLREAVALYGAAVRYVPGLEAMVVTSAEDHVQIAPDHPHIRQALEGWLGAGAWVRLNPAPEYLAEADPSLARRGDLPRNPPNTAPDDWLAAADYALPEDVPSEAGWQAAVYELADRAQGVSGGPTATLTPGTPTAEAPTATPTARAPTPVVSPTPGSRIYLPAALRQGR